MDSVNSKKVPNTKISAPINPTIHQTNEDRTPVMPDKDDVSL